MWQPEQKWPGHDIEGIDSAQSLDYRRSWSGWQPQCTCLARTTQCEVILTFSGANQRMMQRECKDLCGAQMVSAGAQLHLRCAAQVSSGHICS